MKLKKKTGKIKNKIKSKKTTKVAAKKKKTNIYAASKFDSFAKELSKIEIPTTSESEEEFYKKILNDYAMKKLTTEESSCISEEGCLDTDKNFTNVESPKFEVKRTFWQKIKTFFGF